MEPRKSRFREANSSGTYLVPPGKLTTGRNTVSPFNKYQPLCDQFRTQGCTGKTELLGICKDLLPIPLHSHNCSGFAGLSLEIVDLKYLQL